jgi:cytoskeletal protein CcmA (bactofilin family)
MENITEINDNGSSLMEEVLVEGSVDSKRSFILNGRISGDVRCEAQLVVKRDGVITGNVFCRDLYLEGTITGDVEVALKAFVKAGSVINGYLQTTQLVIHPDAEIEKGIQIKEVI